MKCKPSKTTTDEPIRHHGKLLTSRQSFICCSSSVSFISRLCSSVVFVKLSRRAWSSHICSNARSALDVSHSRYSWTELVLASSGADHRTTPFTKYVQSNEDKYVESKLYHQNNHIVWVRDSIYKTALSTNCWHPGVVHAHLCKIRQLRRLAVYTSLS